MEWRTISMCPAYEVSSTGIVRRRLPGRNTIVGKILSQGTDKYGYWRVNLSYGGKVRRISVHVLVCTAFHGEKPSPDHEVAHWDGDRKNNTALNLRWTTPQGNMDDRRRHGEIKFGDKHPCTKISDADILEIRRIYAYWAMPQKWTDGLANYLEIHPEYLRLIIANKVRTNITCKEKTDV